MAPRKKVKTTFKAPLGKPNRKGGNLIIYVPKLEKEIHGLNAGDVAQITLEIVKRAEDSI